MNKLKATFLILLFTLCGISSAYARNWPFTLDFSNVVLDVGQNVDWNYYNRWYLGFKSYSPGAISPGWTGEPLEELTKAPYIYGESAVSKTLQILNVGLTDNSGTTFTPAPTPESCIVTLTNQSVLYVHGVLHIPGNYKEPYIDDLSCTLKRVN